MSLNDQYRFLQHIVSQNKLNPELHVELEEFSKHLGVHPTITPIDKTVYGMEVHWMDKNVINNSALMLKEYQPS